MSPCAGYKCVGCALHSVFRPPTDISYTNGMCQACPWTINFFRLSAIYSLGRRRRHSYDAPHGMRMKRARRDFNEGGFFKDVRRDGRMPMDRYGMRRDDFMNGGYPDFIRDFHHQRPPVQPMSFAPPPPFAMDPSMYYDRPPHHNDFSAPRSRPMDKRAYERSVDDFLRRTARPPSRSDRRYRDRR